LAVPRQSFKHAPSSRSPRRSSQRGIGAKFVGAWRDRGPQAQRYNACIDRMTPQRR